MSDGLTDSRREEREWRCFIEGVDGLADSLDEVYDAAFGLPEEAITEINFAISRFGVKVIRKSIEGNNRT